MEKGKEEVHGGGMGKSTDDSENGHSYHQVSTLGDKMFVILFPG